MTNERGGGTVRTVTDADGRRYLLVKRAGESSLVRDPCTGEERYLPNEALSDEAEPPLVAVARSLPDATRDALPVGDDRMVGLLLEIHRRGPVGVRSLLDDYALCESDLHGALGELRAAGLLEEARVAGERGYRATDRARDLLEDAG